MFSSKIVFDNRSGIPLAARLETPREGSALAFALFAHCFTCSKDYKAVYHISRQLVSHGIGVLRFDFTGLGESGGDFSGTNFASNVDDLVDAGSYLEAEYSAPAVLVGHSLGGAAVIHAARELDSVKSVVTIAAPFDLNRLRDRLLIRAGADKDLSSDVKVTINKREFLLKRHFFQSLEQTSMRKAVKNLGRSLLVVHSPADLVVDIAQGEDLFAAAQQPKSFLALNRADHLLSREQDAVFAGKLIARWVEYQLSGFTTGD